MMIVSTVAFFVFGLNHVMAADPKPKSNEPVKDKALIAVAQVDWIKTYSLAPFSEHWNLSIPVKDFEKDLPKILALFEKGGATLTQPLSQFPASSGPDKTQQLTYKLSSKSAQDIVKKLRKIGYVGEPRITHNGELVNVAEVKDKLNTLVAERNSHRQELAGMPGIAMMTEEMIQHLSMVKQVRESLETQVLLNMTVQKER